MLVAKDEQQLQKLYQNQNVRKFVDARSLFIGAQWFGNYINVQTIPKVTQKVNKKIEKRLLGIPIITSDLNSNYIDI